MMQSRTHTCGELRLENVGEHVQLAGWMENVREVGGSLAFVVVRDFYGKTQLVIEREDLLQQVKAINKESTITVAGTVRERASKNPNLPTGEIEVVPDAITVTGKCIYRELPFEINRSREADEAQRLKYRYLDLRNPEVKQNIILRCQVISAIRKAMTDHGFLEITTPILTASSPEGARDYLVPARKHPGKFYALPQAPQQFKQLLMTSGFDRYFQIAPCFRDEDARGDRSPGEFYQLDMEMSFATQEDVFAVLEDVLPPIFAEYGKYNIASSAPFRRIAYNDALETYGTDKPDLRIDLTAKDVTEILCETEFEPFRGGKAVKAVPVSGCSLTRKQIDKIITDIEVQAGSKPYWFRMDENGAFVGGVAKFLDPVKQSLIDRLGLKPGTLVVLSTSASSANQDQARKTAGVAIKMFGAQVPGHMDRERYEFCWIVDFPMYEIGEESGELEFCHNPFSMPAGGLDVLLKAERGEIDPLSITADQYDLVCNGVELSSGAVRNHDPEIMIKAFEMVRLGEEDVKKKFPAMYNAFCYGAPPHAGIAPGIDRMVMLLAGEDSIREIIPFPMNKSAQDVMMGAPSTVEQKQLDELHIAVVGLEEE
ncbi:MAG: aspartate--tRNA ligase [Oscillospiraceae bacterium]|nr:aspartate--tRNA ligase [Oscillospiraceae bacterium]